jgi:hypothetical protein
MPIKTIFRDNPKTGYREAWQNGEKTYEWSHREVARMHAEAPQTVPAFGHYKADAPVSPGKRKTANS